MSYTATISCDKVGMRRRDVRSCFCMSLLVYTMVSIWAEGSKSDSDSKVTPLAGSGSRFPLIEGYRDEGGELARLLDVGSCINSSEVQESISYVPTLDGTVASWDQTLCRSEYSMNFVLFDLQLVNLKEVDSLNGFFTVELQLVFHWQDFINKVGDGSKKEDCGFLCDTSSPNSLCCDAIWVPPLRIPGCQLNTIQSIMDTPYIYSSGDNESYDQCKEKENSCIWRRLWYLNIEAKCAVVMNFHSFPFDLQTLTLDVLNPYASRTWFQLNKGFLKRNLGDRINGVNLFPDKKISGWYIRDLIVSSSCGRGIQTWQNTFLTQDDILGDINFNKAYKSQGKDIMDALDHLQCANIENLDIEDNDATLANPANQQPYTKTIDIYSKRVNETLQAYHKCVNEFGVEFNLNSINTTIQNGEIPFDISDKNLERSFGLLNIIKDKPTNVSILCTIKAAANLTTPGIHITILIRRVKMYYIVKLILPTIACVTFAFSAFGMKPNEIVGRLTVVVPSAIALTALQSLIVATDIPAVAYLAPTTYIFINSYTIQILIAFESIFVYWLDRWQQNGHRGPPKSATEMQKISHNISLKHVSTQLEIEMIPTSQHHKGSREECSSESNKPSHADFTNHNMDGRWVDSSRILDIKILGILIFIYSVATMSLIVIPIVEQQHMIKKKTVGISMWENYTY